MDVRYISKLVVFCSVVSIFAGCTRNNLPAENDLILTLAKEQWVVSRFNDQGKDETGEFNGIVFSFKQNGKLFVHHAGASIEASWVIVDDTNRMHINLGPNDTTNEPLGALTKAWLIVAHSDKLVSLKNELTGSAVLEFSPDK